MCAILLISAEYLIVWCMVAAMFLSYNGNSIELSHTVTRGNTMACLMQHDFIFVVFLNDGLSRDVMTINVREVFVLYRVHCVCVYL